MTDRMRRTRRKFLLTSLGSVGLLAAGCESTQTASSQRPGPIWPADATRPSVTGRPVPVAPAPAAPSQPAAPSPPDRAAAGPVQAIPRSRWAKGAPIPSRLNPLGNVNRITVHHEGWTPVWFTDASDTAARMDSIRRSHLKRLRAGDIGYHFVIDRAGNIWEGRSLKYQGAHVRGENENNIGIMVLGNFDKQNPSTAQLSTLRSTLISLQRQYRVSSARVYTHQELNRTSCPGRVLQSHMVSLRRNGLA